METVVKKLKDLGIQEHYRNSIVAVLDKYPNYADTVLRLLSRDREIVFYDEDHSYYVDGVRTISTTQLMTKHGISSDLSFVAEDVLREASERGTIIHDEIETYIKEGTLGKSLEFLDFLEITEKEGLIPLLAEFRVSNGTVSGTVDLLAIDKDGKLRIVDYKTGIYKKKLVGYQEGIYNEIGQIGAETDFGICIHLPKTGKRRAIETPVISTDKIQKLLDAESKGVIVVEESLEVEESLVDKFYKTSAKIAEYKEVLKQLELEEKALKEEIKEVMIEQDIYKYSNDLLDFSVTYIQPYTKDSFDSKAFQENHPEIYNEYLKQSTVSGSVRVTISKKNKREEIANDRETGKIIFD